MGAETLSECIARMMHARSIHRLHGNLRGRPVPPESRNVKNLWMQLVLAEKTARRVMGECPRINIWADGHRFLQGVLDEFVARAPENEVLKAEFEKRQSTAKAAEEDFVLSPLCVCLNMGQLMM